MQWTGLNIVEFYSVFCVFYVYFIHMYPLNFGMRRHGIQEVSGLIFAYIHQNAGCAKKSGVFLTFSAIDLPVFSSTTAKTRRLLPAVIFFLIPSCLCHLLNVLLAEITALSVSCSHNGGLDPKAALRSFMQLCKMLSSFLLFFVPVQ